MAEPKSDEFIIRVVGDIDSHFKSQTPISIEVHNPHDAEAGFDLKGLSYIKLVLKRVNAFIQTDKDLAEAKACIVDLGQELEKLKASLVEVKKERDDAVRKNIQVKKTIFEILK